MAKLLWAFDIKSGKTTPDTDPVTGYCEGFLVCANDFEADFEVRSEKRREAILREFEEVEGGFRRFEATGEEKA
jgi:hypothetical protein